MIRVLMLGRLGNNLFQYALGRVLAEKHGVQLVMDGSWFNEEAPARPGIRKSEGEAQTFVRRPRAPESHRQALLGIPRCAGAARERA